MMEAKYEDKSLNPQVLESLNTSKKVKKIVLSFLNIFKSSNHVQEIPKTSIIILGLTESIIFLQFTSIMWRPTIAFNHWTSFSKFWELISYSRIDTILSDLSLSILTYYIFSAHIYLLSVFSIYQIYCAFYKSKPLSFLSWVMKKQLNIGNSVLFLPISITFFSLFLDRFGMFQGKSNESLTYYHFLQEINCAICFGLHIFFSLCVKILDCEMNHGVSKSYLYSKASCEIDIRSWMIEVIIIGLHCLIPDSRIQVIHAACLVLKSWLGIYLCLYIPYYNLVVNKIIFSRIVSETVIAFLFGCNYFIDQSEFLFLSSLLLTPISIFLSFHIIAYRCNEWKGTIDTINVNFFELALREELKNTEKMSTEIVEKFNKFLDKEVLAVGNIDNLKLWESYYCLNALKDPRLTYIKLASLNKKYFSIQVYVQELKIRSLLKEKTMDEIEDINFLDYILKLNMTKQFDKEICELYLKFIEEITGKSPSKSMLKKIGFLLDKKIQQVSESYFKLCNKYPNGIEARKLYKTFSVDIQSKSNFIINLNLKSQSKKELNDINYFDDTLGILIVSGETEDLGRINYTNERFATMLKTSQITLIGTALNSIIPHPYNINHNSTLTRYSRFCITSHLRFPGTLFLKTEKNYLIEFHFKISCLSISNKIFYLVVAKQIENEQICVLLNPEGLIYSHSENLNLVLKSEIKYFENYWIKDLVPELELENIPFNVTIMSYIKNVKWYLVKSYRRIANVEMLILYIVKTSKALDEVIKQNNKEKSIANKNQRSLDRQKSSTRLDEKIRVKFKNGTLVEKFDQTINVNSQTTDNKIQTSVEASELNTAEKQKFNNSIAIQNNLNYSIGKLRFLKVLFLAFLFCIITSVIVNVVYLQKEVKFLEKNKLKASYMEFLDLLGQTGKAVNYINLKILPNENLQDLINLYEKTRTLGKDLISEIDEEYNCPSSPLSFKHESIYFYENYATMYKNRFNLHDTISKFRYYIEKFIQKYQVGNSTATERSILSQNGNLRLYRQALLELSQLDKCQDDIIQEFDVIQGHILVAQLSILLTFFVLQAWLISLFIKGSNNFWNNISLHAFNSFFNIKTKCCERLSYLLEVPEEEINIYNELKKKNKNEFSITYSQIGGYCWRFSIIFLLTGLYLGIFYSVLLKGITSESEEKRFFLNSVSFMKFNLQRVENYSLLRQNNPGYFQILQLKSIEEYEEYRKNILFNNFKDLKQGKLFEYFYDYVNEAGFLRFGLNSAGNWIIMQSFELDDFSTLQAFYENNIDIVTLFEAVINEIVDNGDSKIKSIYQNSIFGMMGYIIICILLCALFYFPYLGRKSKKLLCFQSVFELLVFNDNYQKLRSMAL